MTQPTLSVKDLLKEQSTKMHLKRDVKKESEEEILQKIPSDLIDSLAMQLIDNDVSSGLITKEESSHPKKLELLKEKYRKHATKILAIHTTGQELLLKHDTTGQVQVIFDKLKAHQAAHQTSSPDIPYTIPFNLLSLDEFKVFYTIGQSLYNLELEKPEDMRDLQPPFAIFKCMSIFFYNFPLSWVGLLLLTFNLKDPAFPPKEVCDTASDLFTEHIEVQTLSSEIYYQLYLDSTDSDFYRNQLYDSSKRCANRALELLNQLSHLDESMENRLNRCKNIISLLK